MPNSLYYVSSLHCSIDFDAPCAFFYEIHVYHDVQGALVYCSSQTPFLLLFYLVCVARPSLFALSSEATSWHAVGACSKFAYCSYCLHLTANAIAMILYSFETATAIDIAFAIAIAIVIAMAIAMAMCKSQMSANVKATHTKKTKSSWSQRR